MRLFLFAPLPLLLLACAPQQVPMAVAEAQCVQVALNGGGNSTLVVGGSTGYGGGYWGGPWGWGGPGWGGSGVGIAVATEVPIGATRDPAQVYNSCVQRRTGQPPVTPFNKRPELQG